jgi:hypothetical protein
MKRILFFIGAYLVIAVVYFGYMKLFNKEAVLLKVTGIETQNAGVESGKFILLKSTQKRIDAIDLKLGDNGNAQVESGDILCGHIQYKHPSGVLDFLKISFGAGDWSLESYRVVTNKSKEFVKNYYEFRADHRRDRTYALLRILVAFVVFGIFVSVRHHLRNPQFLQNDGSLVFKKLALITYTKITFYGLMLLFVAGFISDIDATKVPMIVIMIVLLGAFGFLLIVEIRGRNDYLRLQSNYISYQSFSKFNEIPVVHIRSFEFRRNVVLVHTDDETITISLKELNIGSYEETIQLELRRLLAYRAEENGVPQAEDLAN